ncbi:uncharacterized protein LOC141546580 [Sminthopsis crassicaudata]|uniref:uncharacterized protein LOC141546580 n=1 Tax=Sminthopsis crassicaudata TaxID=9301 RepID=UPI003D694557
MSYTSGPRRRETHALGRLARDPTASRATLDPGPGLGPSALSSESPSAVLDPAAPSVAGCPPSSTVTAQTSPLPGSAIFVPVAEMSIRAHAPHDSLLENRAWLLLRTCLPSRVYSRYLINAHWLIGDIHTGNMQPPALSPRLERTLSLEASGQLANVRRTRLGAEPEAAAELAGLSGLPAEHAPNARLLLPAAAVGSRGDWKPQGRGGMGVPPPKPQLGEPGGPLGLQLAPRGSGRWPAPIGRFEGS